MREHYPVFLWNGLFQVFLDLFWSFVLCEAEALGEPRNVCVNYDTRCYPKGIAHNDVCGLSGNSAKRKQVIHRLWDLTAVNVQYSPASGLYVSGLVPKEAC